MLFDPAVLVRAPGMVAAVLLLHSWAAKRWWRWARLAPMGYPFSTAVFAAASLAQIGEFSFILGAWASPIACCRRRGSSLILAGALLSITLNPLVFSLAEGLGGLGVHPAAVGAALRGAAGRTPRRRARRSGGGTAPGRAESGRPQDLHPARTGRALPPLCPARRLSSARSCSSTLCRGLHQPGERILRQGATPPTASISSRQGEVEVTVAGRQIRLGARARSSARWRS